MTDREQIEAIAELCGWVWYRHPSVHTTDRPRRFLAHPAIQECEQSPRWMVRADMTEKLCDWDYMIKEFLIPNWIGSLDACKELIEAMRKDGFRVSVAWGTNPDVVQCLMDRAAGKPLFSESTTPERSICRTFLTAKGKWKD